MEMDTVKGKGDEGAWGRDGAADGADGSMLGRTERCPSQIARSV